jgi:polyisoprenoid-binding protein YceI
MTSKSLALSIVLIAGLMASLQTDLLADPAQPNQVTQARSRVTAISAASGSDGNAPSSLQSAEQIDTRLSRVYIFVGKTGLGHEHGVEGRLKSGSVRLEAGSEAGEMVFDMVSFDADTNAARRYVGLSGSIDASTRQQVNANMKAPAILDVRQYPTATFLIDSCIRTDRKSRSGNAVYELAGRFTLRSVTRPVKFDAEVTEDKGVPRLKGHFTILQTNYGITPFRKAFGAVGVADPLRIYGDIVLGAEKP